VRAYLGWILAIAGVVVAAAAGVAAARPAAYTSTTEVLVQPLIFPNGPQQPNMATEREIVVSGEVTAIASRTLGLPRREVAEGASVTVPADTNILQIRQTTGEPEEARRRSAALADAYVAYRTATALAPGTAAEPQAPARLITPARLPTGQSGVQPGLIIGIGVVVGLGLGLLTALVLDHVNDRVRDVHDVEVRAGRPVLVVLPPPRRGPLVLALPDSDGAEAYRYLWHRVRQLTADIECPTVVVTSAVEKDGKTTAAVNLARAAAETGRRVTMVDAGAGRPLALTTLRAQAPSGPSAEAVHVVAWSPSSSDAGGDLLRSRVEARREGAELVIVDTAPLLDEAETIALTELADVVLLVVNRSRSARTDIVRAAAALRHVGPRFAGCVVTTAPARRGLRALPLLGPRLRPDAAGPRADASGDQHRDLASRSSSSAPATDRSSARRLRAPSYQRKGRP
jgi:Mrp family chromosome partitioning ATPase